MPLPQRPCGGAGPLGVDEDQSSLFERFCRDVQRGRGAPISADDGDVSFAGERATEERYAPQPCGRHDDRTGAEAVQCGNHDRGIGQRRVVLKGWPA